MTNWNPELGTQIAPAWHAIRANLESRSWGSEQVAITLAMRAGDIQRSTAKNLIRDLAKHGYIERRPAPGRKFHQIRLVPTA